MLLFLRLLGFYVLFIGCTTIVGTPPDKKEMSLIGKEVRIFQTVIGAGQLLTPEDTKSMQPAVQPTEGEISIFVQPDKKFQTLIGIGGAATDAAAEVFAGLPEAQQAEFLKAYFDKEEGIGYSFLRTSIHSCDFSSASYTYIEEGDTALHSFSIQHDLPYRIPFIKKCFEASGNTIKLFASPWSPPGFMKSNKMMAKGGRLLPEFYPAWAKYYARFIKAYAAESIPVWGITIQNEPMATQTWESCIYTAEEERDFLKDHLGPTLHQEGLDNVKIIIWDHNRDLINQRVQTILGDPEAGRYAWGIGFHWYETWAGGEPMYENVRQVHESYPEKHLLFTEGCNDRFDSTQVQSWAHAERYGMSMIHDFNAGTEAWTDWNLLLDEKGGPNHVGNYCFSPVHADTRKGTLLFTPAYAYIGHFSKYIWPGARRISAVPSRSMLQCTAFENPDSSIITIVMNPTENEVVFKFFVGTGMMLDSLPAHAIQTLVIRP